MVGPVAQVEVYADYGTFALTSSELWPEFPEDVKDTDIRRGFREVPGGIVFYLPDLDTYALTVEVYAHQLPAETIASSMKVTAGLTISSGGIDLRGLMENHAARTLATFPSGHYTVEGRAFFTKSKNVYQFALARRN
jgi:hypothetical protein